MKHLRDIATCTYTEADGVLVGLYTEVEHNTPVKVNLSFLKNVTHHTFNKEGQIKAHELETVRIASIDLPLETARHLLAGLQDFLKEE